MIGLPDGWDEDVYTEEKLAVDSASRRGSTKLKRQKILSSVPSKAAELLWRATETRPHAAPGRGKCIEADADLPALETSGEDEVPATPDEGEGAGQVEPPPPGPPPATAGGGAVNGAGVFGDIERPSAGDADVRTWTARAPRTLGLAFSFRACSHGGLLAVPVVNAESGGTFRVKLLQLDPTILRSSLDSPRGVNTDEQDLRNGVALLAAQVQAGFSAPVCAVAGTNITSASVGAKADEKQIKLPRLLTPQRDKVKRLVAQYIGVAAGSLGVDAQETIELVDMCFAERIAKQSAGPSSGVASRDSEQDESFARETARSLSRWLSRVNARRVEKYLNTTATGSQTFPRLVELGATDGAGDVDLKLTAVYHHLTANCIQGALRELRSITQRTADGSSMCFDRLATIIASCGGASSPSAARRQWLREQLSEWRSQGVHARMGPALWRIYSLLAGDVDGVVADALDWRTALAMFVWYRLPFEAAPGGQDELWEAVRGFEATVASHGLSCGFRPAPPHARADRAGAHCGKQPARFAIGADAKHAPYDVQFNIIRAAANLADWRDLSLFDYLTHSGRPLDVALSWHLSVVLLACHGGDTTPPGFQVLTQQYCLLLELTGSWEWAIYVALFIRDDRARALAVHGLILRNAPVPSGSDLQPMMKQQWFDVPCAWFWRAQALRSEAAHDWPAAAACWLQCGGPDRALVAALGFLQGPTLLEHAAAPFQRGPTEFVALGPMTSPARWLLSLFEELEDTMAQSGEPWAQLGKESLHFLCAWSRAPGATCEPERLVRLYAAGAVARGRLLGAPW